MLCARERTAPLDEPVEVRRPDRGGPEPADRVEPLVVGDDQQDVRPFGSTHARPLLDER